MRITILTTCLAIAVAAATGCSRMTSEEELVQAAFDAIRHDDWDAFFGTTITAADIMMQQNVIGPFQAQQSYLGSSVRPRERNAQREQFQRAQHSTVADANLRTARFVALGGEPHRFEYTLLTGGSIPATSYSLRVDVDGAEVEISRPRFVVVEWQEQPRLLALSFEQEAGGR